MMISPAASRSASAPNSPRAPVEVLPEPAPQALQTGPVTRPQAGALQQQLLRQRAHSVDGRPEDPRVPSHIGEAMFLIRELRLPATLQAPDLKLEQRLEHAITALPLHRGLSHTRAVGRTLLEMATSKRGTAPVFWGFRKYTPGAPLLPREINTMHAIHAMERQLPVDVDFPLILADVHADHNEIPQAISRPYYEAVKKQAEEIGMKTVWLSKIYKKLDLTPEQISEQGDRLIQRSSGKAPNIPKLSKSISSVLRKQARTLCQRYPDVFEARLADLSNKKQEKFFGDKAFAYARFRVGEKAVLDRFPEYFNRPALPVHIADPVTSEPLNVTGLFIRAKSDHNSNTVHIPWGAEHSPDTSVAGSVASAVVTALAPVVTEAVTAALLVRTGGPAGVSPSTSAPQLRTLSQPAMQPAVPTITPAAVPAVEVPRARVTPAALEVVDETPAERQRRANPFADCLPRCTIS